MNTAKLTDNQRRQILSQQGLDDRAIGKALANPAIARAKTEEDLLNALGQSHDTKRQLPPQAQAPAPAQASETDQNNQHDETDRLASLAQQALRSQEQRQKALSEQASRLEEEAIIAGSQRRGVRLALLAQQVKLDAYSTATLRLNQGFVQSCCDEIRRSTKAFGVEPSSQLTAEQEARERLAPSRDILAQSLGE